MPEKTIQDILQEVDLIPTTDQIKAYCKAAGCGKIEARDLLVRRNMRVALLGLDPLNMSEAEKVLFSVLATILLLELV